MMDTHRRVITLDYYFRAGRDEHRLPYKSQRQTHNIRNDPDCP